VPETIIIRRSVNSEWSGLFLKAVEEGKEGLVNVRAQVADINLLE
jgi:hypothetical protein